MPSVRPLRILVAEDNAVIGMLLAEMLVTMGHEICAIERTEADAVTSALRCEPDLLIADAILAEGSGVAAVETVLRTRHVPHIFMSGAAIGTARADSVVLQKPFSEADMARAIRLAVGDAVT